MANPAVLNLLRTKFSKAKAASGGNYRIPCPTCEAKDRNKMKRYVSPDWTTSNCFICGKIIKLSDLLSLQDFEFCADTSVCSSAEPIYPYAKIKPFEVLEDLKNLTAGHEAIDFLSKDHLVHNPYYSSLGIGYIPLNGGKNIKFESGYTINTANSLYFPVTFMGEYVGWQLRFIPGTVNGDRLQHMRYLHLFPKGEYLFNYDQAKRYKHLVVVEGVKKALKGVNFVATFGKGISTTQKQLIQEWKKITLLLDGEDKTQEMAKELADEINFNGKICVNIDPRKYGFPSPDEATGKQLQEALTSAWSVLSKQ
jgi:hypothetical protein